MEKIDHFETILGKGLIYCLVGFATAVLLSILLVVILMAMPGAANIGLGYFGDLLSFAFVIALVLGAVFGLAGGLIAKKRRYLGAFVGGIVAPFAAVLLMFLLAAL